MTVSSFLHTSYVVVFLSHSLGIRDSLATHVVGASNENSGGSLGRLSVGYRASFQPPNDTVLQMDAHLHVCYRHNRLSHHTRRFLVIFLTTARTTKLARLLPLYT